MDIILSKEQRKVAHAAAKPSSPKVLATPTRHASENVYIKGKKLIAWDGTMLAMVDLPEGTKTSRSDVFIPAKTLLHAKDAKDINGVRISRKNGSHEVRMEDANGTKILNQEPEVFSDINLLMRSELKHEPVFKIALKKQVLQRLCNMIDDDGTIAFKFHGTTERISYEITNGINGVAMPCLIQWPEEQGKKK